MSSGPRSKPPVGLHEFRQLWMGHVNVISADYSGFLGGLLRQSKTIFTKKQYVGQSLSCIMSNYVLKLLIQIYDITNNDWR